MKKSYKFFQKQNPIKIKRNYKQNIHFRYLSNSFSIYDISQFYNSFFNLITNCETKIQEIIFQLVIMGSILKMSIFKGQLKNQTCQQSNVVQKSLCQQHFVIPKIQGAKLAQTMKQNFLFSKQYLGLLISVQKKELKFHQKQQKKIIHFFISNINFKFLAATSKFIKFKNFFLKFLNMKSYLSQAILYILFFVNVSCKIVPNYIQGLVVSFSLRNLTLEVNDQGNYYFKATANIPMKYPLLTLPSDFVHTTFDTYEGEYYFRDLLGDATNADALAGALLVNEHVTKKGMFYEYYCKYNIPDNKKSFYYWKQEDFLWYQQYYGYHNGPVITTKYMETKFKKIKDVNMPHLDKHQPPFVESMFDNANLKKSYQIALTSSLSINKFAVCALRGCNKTTYTVEHGPGLVEKFNKDAVGDGVFPFIEVFIKDRPQFLNNFPFQFVAGGIKPTSERLKLLEWRGFKNIKSNLVFNLGFDSFPIYDDAYFRRSSLKDFINYVKGEPGFIHYLSNKNYTAGDNVTYSYGKLSNYELLAKYGFYDPLNPYDSLIYFETPDQLDKRHSKLVEDFELAEVITKGTKKTYRFDFHRYQINHDYLLLCLLKSWLIETATKYQSIEEIRDVVQNKKKLPQMNYFNAYFYYFRAVNLIPKWQVNLTETYKKLIELESINSNSTSQLDLHCDILDMSIIHKVNIYRHLKWASKKILHSIYSELKSPEVTTPFYIGIQEKDLSRPLYGLEAKIQMELRNSTEKKSDLQQIFVSNKIS